MEAYTARGVLIFSLCSKLCTLQRAVCVCVCVRVFLQMAPIGSAIFTMSNVVNAIGSSLTLRLKYVNLHLQRPDS